MEQWLLFGHVLGAILWVGGGITGSVMVLRARPTTSSQKLTVLELMDRVGPIFGIGSALVIGFGVWLVIESPTIGFGDSWLIVAYAAIAASGLVQAVVAPRLKRLRESLENDDPVAHQQWSEVTRIVPLDSAALIVAVWAMTTKPGL